MVEEYHHRFGTTSRPKFRVLNAIFTLSEPNRSEIEDHIRDSTTESRKLLPSNIKGTVTSGLDQLISDKYIVEIETNPPTYRMTKEGHRILYEE